MDIFGQRLKSERKRLGMNQGEFAIIAGVSKPSQARYESGDRKPDIDYLHAIAQHGVDVMYIILGTPRLTDLTRLDGFAEEAAQFVHEIDGSPEALKQGFLPIPFSPHDQAHAGKGMAPYAFSRAWLVGRGLHPDNLSILEVPHHRMEPTLRKGALVLVDSAPSDNDNEIWAFLDRGELDIARLSFLGDAGTIVNRDHPDESMVVLQKDEAARIIKLGRVVWSGHVLR